MSDLLPRISTRMATLIERVGLFLLFGLLLSILSLWIFTNLAKDVLEGDSITTLDVAIITELHSQATPQSTSFYIILSWIGAQGIVVIGVAIGVFYIVRRRWRHLIFWAIANLGGSLLNTALKNMIARPRHVFESPLSIEHSYSFPSGHAMSSLIAYGILAYFLWSAFPNRYARVGIVLAAVVLIGLIGFSRMALGVHYFSDVMAGFAGGGLWLGVCIVAFELTKPRRVL